MKLITALKRQPIRISFESDLKQWFAFAAMYLLLFLLPIQAVTWLNEPVTEEPLLVGSKPAVLGVEIDTTGRYVTLPLINFRFDTQFKDLATITFVFGVVILLLGLILTLVMLKDFRKHEHKYED